MFLKNETQIHVEIVNLISAYKSLDSCIEINIRYISALVGEEYSLNPAMYHGRITKYLLVTCNHSMHWYECVFMSVSYTHLDVYKRQVIQRVPYRVK